MNVLHEVRDYPAGFMVWESCYDNMGCLVHWHQEIELIYVRQGQADIIIDDSEIAAKKGDLVIVNSNALHYIPVRHYKNKLDFILFDPNIIWPSYHACFFEPHVTAEMLSEYGMEEYIRHLFDTVHSELENQSAYYKEIVASTLKDVMYRLRRSHPSSTEPILNTRSHFEKRHSIQKLLTYIDEHYNEPITLDDAAKILNLNGEYVSRTFSKIIGINYISYRNMVRVEHAADMLCNSNEKIVDIALSCGFDNVRSFNRIFRQYTNTSPSQFRDLPRSVRESLPSNMRKYQKREYVYGDSPVVLLDASNE